MTKKPCAVPKCPTGNKSDKGKCSVFQVPKDVERWKKWQAAIPGVELKSSRFVCEKHFEEKFILREWIKRDLNGCIIARSAYKRPALDKSAVPTIFNSNQTPRCLVADISDDAINSTEKHLRSKSAVPTLLNTNHKAQCVVTCSGDDGMNLPTEHIVGTTTAQAFSEMSNEGPSTSHADEPKMSHESVQNMVSPKKCTQSEEILNQEAIVPERSVSQPEINLQEVLVECEDDVSEVDIHGDDISPIDSMESSSQLETGDIARNVCDCPVTVPASSAYDRDFDVSNINDLTIEMTMKTGTREKYSVSVPKLWGVAKLSKEGQKMAFVYVVTKCVNGIEIPVIAKSITIQTNGKLLYCAYGRVIDPEKSQLIQFLNDPTQLPHTLNRFKNMNVCNGLGAVNTHHLPDGSVFRDNTERWRHNDCPMIWKRKRCKHCMNMRQLILRKERRSKENRPFIRINRSTNPIDQRKLLALRKKSDRVRRLKNRAKQRSKLTRQSLNDKAEQIALIRCKRNVPI